MAGATYAETLEAFLNFLTAYIHTLLYLRSLYPRTSFVHSRFHNTSAYQSRHPLVCEWIRDAITAVRHEILEGTVARVGIVIFSYEMGSKNSNTGTGGSSESGDVQIMERFMIDVSALPIVDKEHQNAIMEWDSRPSSRASSQSVFPESGNDELDTEGEHERETTPSRDPTDDASEAPAFNLGVDTNLAEQMRAALISLTTRCAQLRPLPEKCSFNIALELRDEADIDPPIGHPQAWMPVQPSLQKTGRKSIQHPTVEDKSGEGSTQESRESEERRKMGQDLGGARFTPIRTVESGTFRFETWVEEGRAKFETRGESTRYQPPANLQTPSITLEKSKPSFSTSSGDSAGR